MTLSTNVYVLDEVSPHELFKFCQGLLSTYDEDKRGPDRQDWYDKEQGGSWTIANRIGQGLPAILDIEYRPGAPLRTPEQAAECDEDCEEGCGKNHYYRACWLNIDFDTAYSYRVDDMGCGDLHAALVTVVGKWLDERNVRWEWRNEYNSKVHGGEDRYDRLIDLCTSSSQAEDWYRNTVMPAIAAGIIGGEQK